VTCPAAQVDLRPGGAYTIDNLLPDGSVIRITGEFERVDPPHELVFSWRVGPSGAAPPPSMQRAMQRVTVRFDAAAGGTDVVVRHERIPDAATRADHEQGWVGCLLGLDRLAAAPTSL
jgi:glutathione S-transferase